MTRICLFLLGLALSLPASSQDLPQIRSSGVLRHLDIPCARFGQGSGDGLDVESVRGFAVWLGLRYRFEQSRWVDIVGDPTGPGAEADGVHARLLGETPIRGDPIASGLTILDRRKKAVDFVIPSFASAVWLVARADSSPMPIVPSGHLPDHMASRYYLAVFRYYEGFFDRR